MKKIVLVSILLFLTSKIFSQSLSCGYCDKVITKGQPIYIAEKCGSYNSNGQKWGVIKFTRVNKYVEKNDFFTGNSIEVEENKGYEYQGNVYVNLIDAYDYKWRDILKNKGGIFDYSKYIACLKEHAYYIISFRDQKAEIVCNINLEDHKEIKLTIEQIRTITAEKNEKQRIQREKDSKWDCINRYNKVNGFYELLTGWDGKRWFKYEYTSEKINGRKIKYIYFEDNTVQKRFEDDDSDVPGRNNIGVWACSEDGNGFFIVYLDKSVSIFKIK